MIKVLQALENTNRINEEKMQVKKQTKLKKLDYKPPSRRKIIE